MALFTSTANGGGGRTILHTTKHQHFHLHHHPYTHLPHHQILFPISARRAPNVKVSAKKLSSSSRVGKFDRKNRRSSSATTTDKENDQQRTGGGGEEFSKVENVGGGISIDDGDDDFVLPKLPGDEPDFWEGPQWEPLGFFVQYLWAFGLVFALIACGIAVATYNEGATDFKETPAYKESIQSRELLEEPDTSNSDVFESNPTEVAPSLE